MTKKQLDRVTIQNLKKMIKHLENEADKLRIKVNMLEKRSK
jgi:hypothetical protein